MARSRLSIALVALAIALLVAACATERRITNTPTTALQQLLTSEASDRALALIEWPYFPGKSFYVEVGSPADWGDQFYLQQRVNAYLADHGGLITHDAGAADYRVSVLAGAVGTDEIDVLFGMPPITSMIIPFSLPELALYKAQDQEGFAKVQVVVSDARRGGIVQRSGPTFGRTYVHNRSVLFFGWYTTDTSRLTEMDRSDATPTPVQ